MTERPAEIEQMLQARRLERVSANPDHARKALAAVLAHHGLRARPVGGAHVNTGAAAAAQVSDDSLAECDWMRQVRNSTEYPDISRPPATKQDVEEAIAAASAIAAACAAAVETAVGLDGNHARIEVLSTPDGRGVLELFEYIHPPASPMPPTQPNDLGMHRVAFQVDDLDAALEKAAAHGCHTLRGVADYQGVYRLTDLRGPSGIVVMLAQDMRGD